MNSGVQLPKAGGVDEKQCEKGLNPEEDEQKWPEEEEPTDTRWAVQGEARRINKRFVCVFA